MKNPQRKLQRLNNYDYGQNGVYFITLCTQNDLPLFGEIVDGELHLSPAGQMVRDLLISSDHFYPGTTIENFVVMPNHIHALVCIENNGTTQGSLPTSFSTFVQRMKTLTTKSYIDGVRKGLYLAFKGKIWQKSFHDHIIRDEIDHSNHWDYIEKNPINWQNDPYHPHITPP